MSITIFRIKEKFATVNKLSSEYAQNSDIVEREFFEYARRLNPGLTKNMSFRINGKTESIVENGRFIICYYGLKNIDDFKRLAAIYASAFPHIDAKVIDYQSYEYRTELGKTVYFALSLDARVVLKQVIPVMTQQASASQKNNPQVQPEDIEYERSYSEGYVYDCHSDLLEQKNARELTLNNEKKLALINKIDALCRNTSFWSDKVRLGGGVLLPEGGSVPAGIFQIIKLIETQHDTLPHEQLLKQIGACAAGKYSDTFQFFNAILRGQAEQTNEVYGILKNLTLGFSCDVVSKQLNRFHPEVDEHQPVSSPRNTH